MNPKTKAELIATVGPETTERIEKATEGTPNALLILTDVPGAEVLALRGPNGPEWTRYRIGCAGSPEQKVTETRNLIVSCRLYPDPTDFGGLLALYPGLIETCIGELIEHAGANRAKKALKT
jgi:hypothetical protein